MTPAAALLVLYTRADCQLCDEMAADLGAWLEGSGIAVEVVDVDADPATSARFGLMVPVLTLDGRPVCNGRFDPDVLDGLR